MIRPSATMCAAVLGFVVGGAASVDAAGPTILRLRQVRLEPPRMTAFMSLSAAADRALGGLAAEQFSATLGGQRLAIERLRVLDRAEDGVALVLVLAPPPSLTSVQIGRLRAALTDWVNAIGPKDRVAVVRVGGEVDVQPFTADRSVLGARLGALMPAADPESLRVGIGRALDLLAAPTSALPEQRVIVALGADLDDASRDESLLARAESLHVPMYTLGIAHPLAPGTRSLSWRPLARYARVSGGDHREITAAKAEAAVATIRKRLAQTVALDLRSPEKPSAEPRQRLEIRWHGPDRVLGDAIVIPRPDGPTPAIARPQAPRRERTAAPMLVAVLLAALAVWGVWTRRRVAAPVLDGTPVTAPVAPTSAVLDEPTAHGLEAAPLAVVLTSIGNGASAARHVAPLLDELFIGRDPACDIVISDDLQVSARHCALSRCGDDVMLSDVDSTNGTFVNGVPIVGAWRVGPDDLILLGRTELRISFEERAQRTPKSTTVRTRKEHAHGNATM